MQNNKHIAADFTYEVTAEGYKVKYKGKSIGGASIMGKSKSRGQARQRDIADYTNAAKRDIEGILNGNMPPHYKQAIEAINNNL